jgi:signal transduction histidine kinase
LTSLNKGLELRLEQRTTMVQLVVEQIAMAANKARTIDEALQFATERIAEHQGWLLGHAFVRRDGSADLIPTEAWYVREGFNAAVFRAATMQKRVRRGEGPVGRVAATGQPLWLEGNLGDDRWKRAPVVPKTAIFFPVFRRERPEVDAVLEFYTESSFLPDPAFLALMANVGIQMAHVLERRELERQLAALSEEEQRRVAQDLHDKVGQSVSAVAMLARSLQRKLDEGARLAAEDLAPLLDAAQESKVQLRIIARSLLPEELGGHGLSNALEDLAARYSALHNIAVRFQADHAGALSEGQAIQLFRIAQEAVLNATQHSGASAIQIRLRREDGHTILEVRDNGKGLSAETHADGMGLRIMQHRANLIDARLEILPAQNGGVLVRCSVANEPHPPPSS